MDLVVGRRKYDSSLSDQQEPCYYGAKGESPGDEVVAAVAADVEAVVLADKAEVAEDAGTAGIAVAAGNVVVVDVAVAAGGAPGVAAAAAAEVFVAEPAANPANCGSPASYGSVVAQSSPDAVKGRWRCAAGLDEQDLSLAGLEVPRRGVQDVVAAKSLVKRLESAERKLLGPSVAAGLRCPFDLNCRLHAYSDVLPHFVTMAGTPD